MQIKEGRTSLLLRSIQHAEDLEDVALLAISAEGIPRPIEAEDELPTQVSNRAPTTRDQRIWYVPCRRRLFTITRPSHREMVAKRIHRGQKDLSCKYRVDSSGAGTDGP